MFRKFEAIAEVAGKDQAISLKKETADGEQLAEYFLRAKNARQLFDYLEHGGLTMGACAATLNVIQNMFCPTDNNHTGDILGYYRQREWRLVASELFPRGQQMTHALSPTEIEKLNAVDPRFWTRTLEYEGARYTRSQLALKHSLSSQWSIFDHVDAIYAPSSRLAEVQAAVGSNVVVTATPPRL